MFFVFLALLAFSAVWMIGAYNRLVRLRNQIDAAWAEIAALRASTTSSRVPRSWLA